MPKQKPPDFNDLFSKNPKIKYSCAKQFIQFAKSDPAEALPLLDGFVELFDNDNNILKWTAIDVTGCVLAFDSDERFNPIIERLVEFLSCGKLITVNHAIAALANIGASRHALCNRITDELLGIESRDFESNECRNIAAGKVIEALARLCKGKPANAKVIELLRRQTANSRNATKKKAEKLLAELARHSTP